MGGEIEASGSAEGTFETARVEATRTVATRDAVRAVAIGGILLVLYLAYGYGLYRLFAFVF